jgi:hypothetical protein
MKCFLVVIVAFTLGLFLDLQQGKQLNIESKMPDSSDGYVTFLCQPAYHVSDEFGKPQQVFNRQLFST